MFFFPVSKLFPPLGQGPIVGLLSAALTVVQDHVPDQGPTRILQADPALVLAPMIDLIRVRRILGAMAVVTAALGPGPDPVPGRMDTGAPLLHGLLSPTGEVVGREVKEQDLTGQGHDLARPEATGAAPQMDGNHPRAS